MNLEEQLKSLSQVTYPHQVDVVDSVMDKIRERNEMLGAESTSRPTRIMPLVWRRVAITAVAAIVALVIVNIASVRSYDEEQIGSMMAYFSNYDNYTVESAAANPIELLYGEDE